MSRSLEIVLFGLMVSVAVVHSFSGTDDKFIKKYAMMKIYESCFGPAVVRAIRQEMKAACAKCAGLSDGGIAAQRPGDAVLPPTHQQQPAVTAAADTTKHGHVAVDAPDQLVQPGAAAAAAAAFDADKLHQAILAYRPAPFQPQFRPYGGAQPFYPGYGGPAPVYYPANAAAAGFPQPYSQFAAPFYPHQFYGHGARMSRDMSVRDQIDALTNRMSGRVRNVTCVMQVLGYLDDNLEPNFDKIAARIASLPVDEELRKDMQDGVTFCRQFSQCIPETNKEKSPLSRELVKPMFFFRCYKHKKLEACILKDVRERFQQESDADFDALADGVRSDETRYFRSAKGMRQPEDQNEEMAAAVYEFLYGEASLQLDSLL